MKVVDLIKASSMAIGLSMIITLLGWYVIPPVVFVNPGYSVYVTGIVDHKKIGEGLQNGQPFKWYTVSVRSFDDGGTRGYVVSKADWEMVEWGDTVKIRLLSDVEAEIVELFPSVKLPEWHGLAGSNSPIDVEIISSKSLYRVDEKASFYLKIKNDPEKWDGSSIPANLTLFKTSLFWIFRDGEKVFSQPSDREIQEIVLQPREEIKFSFEWNLVDDRGNSVSEGIYYLRVYLGYFTEDEETTLSATTVIEVRE